MLELKWKNLLAELTIKLLKFDDDLTSMDFERFLGVKPPFKTFEMNGLD